MFSQAEPIDRWLIRDGLLLAPSLAERLSAAFDRVEVLPSGLRWVPPRGERQGLP